MLKRSAYLEGGRPMELQLTLVTIWSVEAAELLQWVLDLDYPFTC